MLISFSREDFSGAIPLRMLGRQEFIQSRSICKSMRPSLKKASVESSEVMLLNLLEGLLNTVIRAKRKAEKSDPCTVSVPRAAACKDALHEVLQASRSALHVLHTRRYIH